MSNLQVPQVETDLIATLGPMGRRQKLTILALFVVALWGWIAYAHQARYGLAVTAMNDYFSWGIYIINFVFFIGISMAGTLISAMLRLSGAHWRGPITRLAEAITLFSLLIAGPMVIIDMGRPDRFYMILLHGRFQSPILWDVLSLTTYMAGSLLYLYLPMVPDMAILRDYPGTLPKWRRKLYTRLSLGWTGTDLQRRILDRAIFVMAIVILPVAVSIHTVTAWLFGMTLRPGWHTTIIGPDFVVGALYSGVAAVITVIALFRKFFRLERYLTPDHFSKLANLLLVFGLIYAYFVVNEHVGSIYTNEGPEQRLDRSMFGGTYTYQFWAMVLIGLVLPVLMLCVPRLRTAAGIVTASILVNIGMWLKRYVIVVPTLAAPFMPVVGGKPLNYVPTWVEWSITVGAFAGLSLMYVVFARIFPIISIWEMQESHEASANAPVASRRLPAGAGLVTGLLIAAGVGILTQSARAAETQPASSTQPSAQVALAVVTEDKEQLVRATITFNGKPVENATVQFFAGRTFGNLKLGEDKTLDDGTAAVKFPTGLPGGANGELNLIAEVTASTNYAGACTTITASGGVPARAAVEPFPRALWAPHAPIILLVVIACLFGSVWITYAYVTWQLFALRKGASQ
jgi:Ni/Fe-hydrogenase subunit HybB-like protein